MPPAAFSQAEPPPELLSFVQVGRCSSESFAAFLRAREAWRDTHDEPLPMLPPKERHALEMLDLPAVLVEAERRAPKREPEWRRRQLARGITDPREPLQ